MLQFILSAICLYFAFNLKDPHLLQFRHLETPSLVTAGVAGLLLVVRCNAGQPRLRFVTALLWMAALAVTACSEYAFQMQRRAVQGAAGDVARQLQAVGSHIVVGYDTPNQIEELVRRGFIGGIYLTRRNAAGKTVEALNAEVAALQSIRRAAGFAPLIVAADQEGGPVSHLSPPLQKEPALAMITESDLPAQQLRQLAAIYGIKQAKALKSVGVNVNLSPVVDLKPDAPVSELDFHTRIAERAISRDPAKVTEVALGYCEGLLSQGVVPTLKHFPGLANVAGDTHHFRAHLQSSVAQLVRRDWQPFRTIIEKLPVFLMVSHVVVDQLDPDLPASQSSKVISDVLRMKWNFQGVLISDDMTMAASYDTGLCPASIRALNAGIDILLVSYDWEKVYPVLSCLQHAQEEGTLRRIGPKPSTWIKSSP